MACLASYLFSKARARSQAARDASRVARDAALSCRDSPAVRCKAWRNRANSAYRVWSTHASGKSDLRAGRQGCRLARSGYCACYALTIRFSRPLRREPARFISSRAGTGVRGREARPAAAASSVFSSRGCCAAGLWAWLGRRARRRALGARRLFRRLGLLRELLLDLLQAHAVVAVACGVSHGAFAVRSLWTLGMALYFRPRSCSRGAVARRLVRLARPRRIPARRPGLL